MERVLISRNALGGGRVVAIQGQALEEALAQQGEMDEFQLVANELVDRLFEEAFLEPREFMGLWLWQGAPTGEWRDDSGFFVRNGELLRAGPVDLRALLLPEASSSAAPRDPVPTNAALDRAFVVQPRLPEKEPLVVGLAPASAGAYPVLLEEYGPELEGAFAFVESPVLLPGLWVWEGRFVWVADLEFDDPDELFWPMREKLGRLDKCLGVVNGHAGSFRRPTEAELLELAELPLADPVAGAPHVPPAPGAPPSPGAGGSGSPASGAPVSSTSMSISDQTLHALAHEDAVAEANRTRRGQLIYGYGSLGVLALGVAWLLWALL